MFIIELSVAQSQVLHFGPTLLLDSIIDSVNVITDNLFANCLVSGHSVYFGLNIGLSPEDD